jgi:hypothetical protein
MLVMVRPGGTRQREGKSYPALVVVWRTNRSWCGANVDGKKKCDEEAKMQKKVSTEKANLSRPRRSLQSSGAAILFYGGYRIFPTVYA